MMLRRGSGKSASKPRRYRPIGILRNTLPLPKGRHGSNLIWELLQRQRCRRPDLQPKPMALPGVGRGVEGCFIRPSHEDAANAAAAKRQGKTKKGRILPKPSFNHLRKRAIGHLSVTLHLPFHQIEHDECARPGSTSHDSIPHAQPTFHLPCNHVHPGDGRALSGS